MRRDTAGLVVLAAALVLAAVAGNQVWALWARLPGVQMRRIDWTQSGSHRAAFTGTAREGLALLFNSKDFTAAWQQRMDVPAALDRVRARLALTPSTQLGRMQFAALLILDAERRDQPPAAWWTTAGPHLSGLSRASFAHHFADLLTAEQEIYVAQGVERAAAFGAAQAVLAAPHGPLLEYLVPRLATLERSLRDAGDNASADACRHIRREWLRQWIIEPANPTLQMLAAELLADELTGGVPATSAPAAGPTALEASLAERCRAWRAAYRKKVAATPAPPALLQISDDPPAPDVTLSTFEDEPFYVTSAAIATAVALVAGIATLFSRGAAAGAATHGRPPHVPWVLTPLPVLLSAVVTLGLGVAGAWEKLATDDMRRLGLIELGWPRLPLLAALVTSVALVGCAALFGRRRALGWRGQIARFAAVTTILMSVRVIMGGLVATEVLQYWLEPTYARGVENLLARFGDVNTIAPFEALRAWHP